MDLLSERLRQYVRAISDPTRGAIVMELEHAGELTPTQLARRLGLTANNVYHHMRVLRELGVVGPPRAVPRETYVEKYYRLEPELRAVVSNDPEWLDRTQAEMTPEDRKALFVGMCLTMSQLLRRAAQRYEAMDAAAFDDLFVQRMMGMVSINEMGRTRLTKRLHALRDVLREEQEQEQEGEQPGRQPADAEPETDLVLMAGLPLIWDAPGADEKPGSELDESSDGKRRSGL